MWFVSLRFYGVVLGQDLFITKDDERGGLHSNVVREKAEQIAELI